MRTAVLTPRHLIPAEARARLAPLLDGLG
jgi:hypothetical protein